MESKWFVIGALGIFTLVGLEEALSDWKEVELAKARACYAQPDTANKTLHRGINDTLQTHKP